MIMLLTGIVATAALGLLSVRFGAEQRPGFDERGEPQPHRYGLL